MPRIDQYVSTGTIQSDRGGAQRVQANTAPQRAQAQLGGAIQQLGAGVDRVADIYRQAEDFSTDTSYQRFRAQEANRFEQAKLGMEPGAVGFADSQVKARDTEFQNWLSTQPTRVRQEYEQRDQVYRERFIGDAGRVETTERIRQQTAAIEQTTNELVQIAYANPGDVETTIAEGRENIMKSNLPPTAKQAAVEAWDLRARESAWRGLLEADPEAAMAALGVQAEEPVSSGPENVVNRIIGVESGGNASAKNPKSSATGLGQFIDSTWMNMINKHRPDVAAGRSKSEVLALRNDPALSREMTTRLTEDNARALQATGYPTTDGNLYLAHFAGVGGAVSLLRADPTASAASVLGQSVVNANPHLKGMNAGDVIRWANKKMTGGGPVVSDPAKQFAAIPLERRLQLARSGQTALNKQMTADRSDLATEVANQVAAIQQTGQSDQPQLTLERFEMAYPQGQAQEKFEEYQNATLLASDINRVATLPPGQQQSMLEAQRPTDTSDPNYARELNDYNVLANAIAQDNKRWSQDQVGSAHAASPELAVMRQRIQDASTNGGNVQVATQNYRETLDNVYENKGIPPNQRQYLGGQQADAIVENLDDVDVPARQRMGAVVSEVFATDNPQHQQAVYQQLVEAGMPRHMSGVLDAYNGGYMGAFNRLTQDALIDPKDVPLPEGVKNADIEAAINESMFADGSIGSVYHGLDMNVTDNTGGAVQDSELLKRAITRRMALGSSIEDATASAVADLFTEKEVAQSSGILAVVPTGTDLGLFEMQATHQQGIRTAFADQLTVNRGLELQRLSTETEVDERAIATYQAETDAHIEDIIENGVIRSIRGGYGLIDQKTGLAVALEDGTPMVFSLEEVMTYRRFAEGDERNPLDRGPSLRGDSRVRQPFGDLPPEQLPGGGAFQRELGLD